MKSANKEIRLEGLVGTRVRDSGGNVVGRIREVEAEWHGNECVVTKLHLGKGIAVRVVDVDVDLRDPQNPRLRSRGRFTK